MFSPSDYNDAVPKFTNGNYANTPLNPLYVEEPDSVNYNRGAEPLQTLPAQWWNWLANKITAKLNNLNTYVKNIFDELANLLSVVGETPDATEQEVTSEQLKDMFQTKYPLYLQSNFSTNIPQESSNSLFNADGAYNYLIWLIGKVGFGTWKQGVTNGSDITINAIQYHNGIFVIATSVGCWWSEDGATWVQGTASSSNITDINASRNVVCYGNGTWVAGGSNSASEGLWWSDNGKNWNKCTGFTSTNGIITGMFYDETKGWIAVARRAKFLFSTDGKTWTEGTYSTGTLTVDILFCSGTQWVYGVSNSSQNLEYSNDGETWNDATSYATNYYTVTKINGIWMAGGYDGIFYREVENITNTKRLLQSSFTGVCYCITSGFGLFVAGCDNRSSSSGKAGCWWSEDGATWTKGTGFEEEVGIVDIIYADNKLLALGINGYLFESTDGKAWTKTSLELKNIVSPNNLSCSTILVFGNNKLVLARNKFLKNTYNWFYNDKLPLLE